MLPNLRLVEAPLASYFRPGRNDHGVLAQLLSENQLSAAGLVVDPVLVGRHAELVVEAGRQGLETVLDPRSVDLSTPAGFELSGVANLPWAPPRPHTPELLAGPSGLLLAEELAEFAVKEQLSALLAPTHIVSSAADPWLTVDAQLVWDLRRALDSRGRADTPIYYPLTVRSSLLYDSVARQALIAHLGSLPIDAVWLRVHPFGTTSSGPVALRRYVEACRALHDLRVPLVGEHTGTVGVALLALGAVGGIESGLTFGERVDLDRYLKRSNGKPFSPAPRVYLHALGTFVTREQAEELFTHRGMRAAHGCRLTTCCRHGWRDMVEDPRRHFVVQRGNEVASLSRTPAQVRPNVYLDEFLRPASDRAVRASEALPVLGKARRRLDSWRGALGAIVAAHEPVSVSSVPTGERVRR